MVPHYYLKLLAAATWYTGSIILFIKGFELLREAHLIFPEANGPWYAAITGLLIGGVKAKWLFIQSCKKNLDRINTLSHPKFWQFFRPRFFFFMALMISFGATLSHLAHNHYTALLAVATLDLSIALALLISSKVFWEEVNVAT